MIPVKEVWFTADTTMSMLFLYPPMCFTAWPILYEFSYFTCLSSGLVSEYSYFLVVWSSVIENTCLIQTIDSPVCFFFPQITESLHPADGQNDSMAGLRTNIKWLPCRLVRHLRLCPSLGVGRAEGTSCLCWWTLFALNTKQQTFPLLFFFFLTSHTGVSTMKNPLWKTE